MKVLSLSSLLLVVTLVASSVQANLEPTLVERDAIVNGEDRLVYRHSVPSWPHPTPKGCKKDWDCKKGYYCCDGKCIPPKSQDKDKYCKKGEHCKSGHCAGNRCVKAHSVKKGGECSADEQCKWGNFCSRKNWKCKTQFDKNHVCSRDYACASYECKKGKHGSKCK